MKIKMTYLDLLNIKYKKKKILLLLIILFIALIIYILNIKIYDTYDAISYVKANELITKVNIDNPDTINGIKYVVIDNKRYKAKVKEVGDVEVDEDNLIVYQNVIIKYNGKLHDNQVVKVRILSNKEKVYKKLKKMLF